MTSICNRAAIAALAAIALFSCRMAEPESFVQKTAELTLSAAMPGYISDGDTRTHWNGSTIKWSAGDRVSVCLTSDEHWQSDLYKSEAVTESCDRAFFRFSVPSSISGTVQFYALYPSSVERGFSQAPSVKVSLPSSQTPSVSSYDPAADLMAGKSADTYDGVPSGDVPILWERLVAHADMTIFNLPFGSTEKIKSVSFKVQEGAALAGDFLLDMTTYKLKSSSDGKVTNEIILNVEGLEVSDNGEFRVWAAFIPLTVTSLEIAVTTDKAVYVKTQPSCSLKFRRNVRNCLRVDMSSAIKDILPEEKEKLNALVNPRIFDVLDLDRPGMEQVKSLHSEGESYKAAQALLEYWRTSRDVVNPEVDLTVTEYSSEAKERADMALEENGYRFYVKNYGYQSFSDGRGGIDWTKTLQGETQFTLQKHRHQWVLPQAKVYWGTKDEKYVKSYMQVYTSWLAAHPCPVLTSGSYVIPSSNLLRDMWTDLQATSRVMDQISVLDYYISSPSMTPDFLSHFLVAYADAVECIRANPYYEPLSNHRLYEIQAVFTAAVMMPEFKNADAWLSEASEDIDEQVKVQFAEDGVLVEMDPGYHIPMVAIFYDTHKIASANGKLSYFPSDFKTYLHKAVAFVRDLAYPDYSIEDFNDVRSSSWNKSTLTKNFVKYAEMFPDDKTLEYWATGFASGSAPTEKLSLYTTTGWYMLRNGWAKSSTMLVLKNNYNVKADGGIWWHCQPDNGTVSLYHNGRHFLPDAGAYTYTNGNEREAFRATAMHNTLTRNLETIADSQMRGEYVASGTATDYSYVYVKNQSYGNTRHERVVFQVKDKYYVIVDAALGSAKNTSMEVSWHLCPGNVSFESYGANAYGAHTAFSDRNNVMFKTFCFSGEKGIIADNDFAPSTGTSYTSSEINQKSERKFYRTAVKIGGTNTPVRFITVIYPVSDYSSAPAISASFDGAPNKIKVTVADQTVNLQY